MASYSSKDVVERCENRLSFLSNKLNESVKTIQAVNNSADSAKILLENQMNQIKENFNRALKNTFDNLCSTIDQAVKKDLKHLKEVEDVLEKDMQRVKALIAEAQCMEEKEDKAAETSKKIYRSLSDIGKGIPDIPVASLSISPKINEPLLTSLEEKVSDLLKLNMTGTVQIVECVERPGALVITWDEQQGSDSESVTTDASVFTEFILQISENDDVFTTIYEGDEMQYTMNFAESNKMYSFRVCHYMTGGANGTGGVCGPWSMVKKACTTLPPHVWRESDCMTENGLQLYQLSSSDRTATKIFPESSRILRSKDASYLLGQQLTFWIEETGESSLKDGIGFIAQDKQIYKQLTQSEHAAILNTRGAIFVNGAPMVTKLPGLKRGSVVVFNAQKQSSGKLRISITIDDKEVTFDWSTEIIDNNALYFACGFEHTGWKVSVG